MADQDDISEQQQLLKTYRRTLSHYLHQQAILGSAHVPPEITHGIHEARKNIRRIKSILHGWGIDAANHPNDEEVSEAPEESQTTITDNRSSIPFAQVSYSNDALKALQASSKWHTLISETFQNDKNPWLTGEHIFTNSVNRYAVADNYLNWEITVKKWIESWNLLGDNITPHSDFYLQVDAQKMSGPENSSYGVVFRSSAGQEHEHYSFRVTDTRHFIVTARYEGKISNLIRWTTASVIQPGSINRLVVIAQGTNYYFFINNSFVGSINNDLLVRGQLGLCVCLERINDSGVFRFRNVEVRTPSRQ